MNINEFANRKQWGQANLGDARRTQRAIEIGEALVANPNGSLLEQMQSWGKLKAGYRLLSAPNVSHTALSQPDWQELLRRFLLTT